MSQKGARTERKAVPPVNGLDTIETTLEEKAVLSYLSRDAQNQQAILNQAIDKANNYISRLLDLRNLKGSYSLGKDNNLVEVG